MTIWIKKLFSFIYPFQMSLGIDLVTGMIGRVLGKKDVSSATQANSLDLVLLLLLWSQVNYWCDGDDAKHACSLIKLPKQIAKLVNKSGCENT